MNCTAFQFEMQSYSDRDQQHPAFAELRSHLASCTACGRRFVEMRERDRAIADSMQAVMPPPDLEQRILSGWRHMRLAPQPARRALSWRLPWTWPSAVAWSLALTATVLGAVLGLRVYGPGAPRPTASLVAEAAVALSETRGRLQYETPDRDRILAWAGGQVGGRLALAPNLDRVQFRGARRVQVAHRPAVLLAMRNEQRASLLVLPNLELVGTAAAPQLFSWERASAAVWSEAHQTYALVFAGSPAELNRYMHRMGIVS